jgi:hypothetical protein
MLKQTKMKKLIRFFVAVIVMFAFTASAFSQATATATATATIVTPIAISKTVDLSFGNIAAGAGAGTVLLNATTGIRTPTGVTLPAITGVVTAASFNVTGTANFTYAITLPGAATTITDGAAHTMTVITFTSNPAGTGTLSGAGSQALTVGATLNVGALQVPGNYSSASAGGSGPFPVTVNYN